MVFGWGKKKQETTDITQEAEVELAQISSLLSPKKEEIRKKIVTQSRPLFTEIKQELDAIYKIIEHLKQDDLKVEDIEKILRVIVTRAKTEVIDVISKESEKKFPIVDKFEDVLGASESVSYSLKKIGDVLGKNSRVIHVFAKKYAQEIKDHLALVTKDHTIVSKMLYEHSAFESSSDFIGQQISKTRSLSQQITEHNAHLKKLQELLSTAQQDYAKAQELIIAARNSQEFQKLQEIQSKQLLLVEQKNEMAKQIDDEFSKVSRALGKYVYVTSLDKPLKSILERLAERPSLVVGIENTESIKTILESCMKGIVSGTVSVKENDKSVEQIGAVIAQLDSLAQRKTSIEYQITQTEQSMKQFEGLNLVTLQKQLEKSKSDQDDAQSKIKNLEKDIKDAGSQKQETIQKLESSLYQLFRIKYRIRE